MELGRRGKRASSEELSAGGVRILSGHHEVLDGYLPKSNYLVIYGDTGSYNGKSSCQLHWLVGHRAHGSSEIGAAETTRSRLPLGIEDSGSARLLPLVTLEATSSVARVPNSSLAGGLILSRTTRQTRGLYGHMGSTNESSCLSPVDRWIFRTKKSLHVLIPEVGELGFKQATSNYLYSHTTVTAVSEPTNMSTLR
ncbi:MAG: hypothetical protein M1840_008372 [Geoglossum simile]|nr:MAG: hypothetical protein M1840_008372 [Geoglossum simile]